MSEEPIIAIPVNPAITRDVDWWAGREDGILGQTWHEHRRMLEFQAEHEHAIAREEIEKRLARARAELTTATEVKSSEAKAFGRIQEQLTNATQDRDRYPTQYSVWMGIIFLVCAVAIIGADFPLSRAIARQILRQRTFLLDANLVAWGIVAMGLFFKLLADPFMRPRYLMSRYLRPLSWGISIIIACVIALALSAVLAMLGIFRGNTVTSPPTTTATTTGAPATTTSTGPQAAASDMNGVFAELQDVGLVAKVTFFALALVLPIIGGIFAATGSARLHNVAQLRRAQRSYENRKQAYEAVVSDFHERTAQVENHLRDLTIATSRVVDADRRYHTYLHGYERGLCSAEPEHGIAAEVVSFISRWVAAARQRENFIRTTAIASTQPRISDEEHTPCDGQPS